MQTIIELGCEVGGGGPGKAPSKEEYLYTMGETLVRGGEDCLFNINKIMDLGEVTDANS